MEWPAILKIYHLSLLSAEDIKTLILYFGNGWAEETRKRMKKQTLFGFLTDMEIVQCLQRGRLYYGQMEIVMEHLKGELSFHQDKADLKRIMELLDRCPLHCIPIEDAEE